MDPTMIVAEIGINHNGSLKQALELVRLAQFAGADAVKFQKRTPRLCVPRDQWELPKETPWGTVDYIDYRERMEFDREEYDEIADYCREINMPWFMSVWDEEALKFALTYRPPYVKIGSASFNDHKLVARVMSTGTPVILSTGMSTQEDVEAFVKNYHWRVNLTLCQCTSIYPCPPDKIDLSVLTSYRKMCPPGFRIGYSGHEVESGPTIAAVALGARYIERHITDDRSKWGSDQRASLDAEGFRWMVQQVRRIEEAMGSGAKTFYPEEQEAAKKLRRVQPEEPQENPDNAAEWVESGIKPLV